MCYSTVIYCKVVSKRPSASIYATKESILFTGKKKMYFYVFNIFANDIWFYYRTDNMLTICFGCFWVISIMLKYINDVYDKWCMTEKCYLNCFEGFDCLLLLEFKLRKYWLMNWRVKLFMDLYWKHELNACSWN
jgi:hypothetical protein